MTIEPELPRLVVQGIELRDYLALTASELDIQRFREYAVPPQGGREKPQYTVEQARYRYANAMLAARNHTHQ